MGATETYTHDSGAGSQDDFATSLTAALQIRGDGARVKLNGSIAATEVLYARQPENNSFAPTVNLLGSVEAIEKFAFVEAQASVTQTFASPFGPRPPDLATVSSNRYTNQTYRVSPYIQGGVPGTKLTYSLRDDNIWTIASPYGNSSIEVPNTYDNHLIASISSSAAQWGWTLEYDRDHYDNGISNGVFTTEIVRGILPYQIDPQLQIAARGGYESDRYPLTSSEGPVYGVGGRWNPTERTNVNGFWEHRFFGSSYSAQISHRLPQAALSANFSRGLNSYPELALLIPAGASVASFLDAAFSTRIPDPAERALAIEQFFARTGLPPTLASPVNVYGASIQLQQTATVSLVLIGVRNALGFTLFNVDSEAISGTGSVLPPALQFGQNNTQTGGGINFSHSLSGQTNLVASANYFRTKLNTTDTLSSDTRSNNSNFSLALSTSFGPKTSASTGLTYTRFEPVGGISATASETLNIYASINHTF